MSATDESESNWESTQFVNDVLFRSDITSEESQEFYRQWVSSQKYDSMISQPEIYHSLRVLGVVLKELFPSPQQVLALDIGSGTGLTGQVLRNAGITTIHALEPQKESADISMRKGIYSKIIPEFLSKEKTPGIEDDTYDLIVSTGSFAPGHIPHDALIELSRVGKPVDMEAATETKWQDTQYVNQTLLKPGISVGESQELYRQWAVTGTYDKMLQKNPKEYAALKELSEAVTGLWSNSDALILDIGAGTGLSGLILQDAGYHNIHALEPLSEFAQIAEQKGIYKRILQEFIGVEDKPVTIADNTYDGVVSSGALGPGHIPVTAIAEMIRITKPGGYIVHCMREEYLTVAPEYKDTLQPTMDRLEREGKWKLVERKIYPNHFVNKNGLMIKYQVC